MITKQEFVEQLAAEIKIISDMGKSPGRYKQSVLGDRRCQVDIAVGVEIMSAMMEKISAEGVVLDPAFGVEMIQSSHYRRATVSGLLYRMSRVTLKEIEGQPIKSLYDSLGDLIRMRRQNPEPRGKGGPHVYVLKETATVMETIIAFNTHREKALTKAKRDQTTADIYQRAIEALEKMDPSITLMAAYAQEAASVLGRSA